MASWAIPFERFPEGVGLAGQLVGRDRRGARHAASDGGRCGDPSSA